MISDTEFYPQIDIVNLLSIPSNEREQLKKHLASGYQFDKYKIPHIYGTSKQVYLHINNNQITLNIHKEYPELKQEVITLYQKQGNIYAQKIYRIPKKYYIKQKTFITGMIIRKARVYHEIINFKIISGRFIRIILKNLISQKEITLPFDGTFFRMKILTLSDKMKSNLNKAQKLYSTRLKGLSTIIRKTEKVIKVNNFQFGNFGKYVKSMEVDINDKKEK